MGSRPAHCPELVKAAREQLAGPEREGVVFSSKHGVWYVPIFTARVATLHKFWKPQIDIVDPDIGVFNSTTRVNYQFARDNYNRVLLRMFGGSIFSGSFFDLIGGGPALDPDAVLAYCDAVMDLAVVLDSLCTADVSNEELVDVAAGLAARGARRALEAFGIEPWMVVVAGVVVLVVVLK